MKVTIFIGQSDDIVTIKQWGMYILLVHYYNGTPEPITAQLLVWSELISPRETTVVLFLCGSSSLGVNIKGGSMTSFL